MARTAIPVQTTGRVAASANITWTAADSVNNHTLANTGENVILLMKNTSASPVNVTISRSATIDGTALSSVVYAVPATTGIMVAGPFPASLYNQTGSVVNIDVASSSGVSFGALKLGPNV